MVLGKLAATCERVKSDHFLTPCAQSLSRVRLCDHLDCSPPGSSVHGNSPGKNTGVGCHPLLQWIFPSQGIKPKCPALEADSVCLSHQGSPRILEWVTIPSPVGLPDPGIEPGSPALQAYSLPTELSGKPPSATSS